MWCELREKMWWLDADDAPMFEGLCSLHARIRRGAFQITDYNAWLRTMSLLGGAPTQRHRIFAERGIGNDEPEPEDL